MGLKGASSAVGRGWRGEGGRGKGGFLLFKEIEIEIEIEMGDGEMGRWEGG